MLPLGVLNTALQMQYGEIPENVFKFVYSLARGYQTLPMMCSIVYLILILLILLETSVRHHSSVHAQLSELPQNMIL